MGCNIVKNLKSYNKINLWLNKTAYLDE